MSLRQDQVVVALAASVVRFEILAVRLEVEQTALGLCIDLELLEDMDDCS
jgi:hypothetical protein